MDVRHVVCGTEVDVSGSSRLRVWRFDLSGPLSGLHTIYMHSGAPGTCSGTAVGPHTARGGHLYKRPLIPVILDQNRMFGVPLDANRGPGDSLCLQMSSAILCMWIVAGAPTPEEAVALIVAAGRGR